MVDPVVLRPVWFSLLCVATTTYVIRAFRTLRYSSLVFGQAKNLCFSVSLSISSLSFFIQLLLSLFDSNTLSEILFLPPQPLSCINLALVSCPDSHFLEDSHFLFPPSELQTRLPLLLGFLFLSWCTFPALSPLEIWCSAGVSLHSLPLLCNCGSWKCISFSVSTCSLLQLLWI